jgi:septation ring formation regulator EzrA
MTGIRRDFLASHLRTQISRLSSILNDIDEENKADFTYAHEALKEVEEHLHQLRKLCPSN